MTVQPVEVELVRNGVAQKFDAEISVEAVDGSFHLYRKEAKHNIWFEVVNLDTDAVTTVKDHQYQVSLNAIWYNHKTLSGLYRKS